MRRKTTPAYCFLETADPVWHYSYDKRFRKRKVFGRVRLSHWYPARTLAELIRGAEHDIRSRRWKSNPRAGTVNGVKMRRVRSRTYGQDNFTREEINAPQGYGWWEYLPKFRQVRLLSVSASEQREVDQGTERGRLIAAYPRYLAPLERPLPKGWKMLAPFDGFIQDAARREDVSIAAAEHYVRAFADGCADDGLGGAFSVPEIEECVRYLFRRRIPRAARETKFVEVGSCALADSAKVLYRLLYWFKGLQGPGEDFYKGVLCRLFHPDGRWAITVEFWKYELSLRFYAAADDVSSMEQERGPVVIRCGVPGVHNGEKRVSRAARQYFSLFRRLIGRRTMIYAGNNFEV